MSKEPVSFAAAAVEKERARCAAIARAQIITSNNWDTSAWNEACERIASAIEGDASAQNKPPLCATGG